MGYLMPGDYAKQIQADNLLQVTGQNPLILVDAEALAVEDARSGLVQKYEVDDEFTDTLPWSKTGTYEGNERVYLTAQTFSASSAYAANNYVAHQPVTGVPYRNVYIAIGNVVAGAFNINEWTLIGQEYTIYSPVLPAATFSIANRYKAGDIVYWKGKVYTCVQATTDLTAEDVLQYFRYENVPPRNVIPDDVDNGAYFWGAGVPFNIPPNTEITDATKWRLGDNRCKQVVWCVVSLVLYYIHARIAPRNVPEQRKVDADVAEARIKEFAEGKKTPKLPAKQPRQGARIRYGGNIKNNNTY